MYTIYLVGRRQGANSCPRLLLVYTAMSSSSTARGRGLGQQHRLGSVSQTPTFVYAFMLSTSQDKEMAPSPMRDNRRQRRRQDHVPTVQRPDLLVISWYVTAVEQGIGDENRAPPPLVQNAFRWAGGTRARRQRSTSSGYGFLARHGRKPGTAKKRAGWAARPDAREERG